MLPLLTTVVIFRQKMNAVLDNECSNTNLNYCTAQPPSPPAQEHSNQSLINMIIIQWHARKQPFYSHYTSQPVLIGTSVRSLLWAGVQPTLNPSTDILCWSNALEQGRGELVGVCDVCATCRVKEGLSMSEQLVGYFYS